MPTELPSNSHLPQSRSLSAAVVIPTYNRPRELRRCLDSLLRQTLLPDQIVIVDDGDLDYQPLAESLEATGVDFLYLRKQGPRGQALSRNQGTARATGDVVFFFDDDVELDRHYLETIMRLYEADFEGRVGGIGGVIVNDPVIGPLRALAELLRGTPSWGHGRVFACGFNQMNYHAVRRLQPVQWLGGGVSSFRREVLSEFQFCEDYREYAHFEDVEHSYRVAQRYRLLITPEARLWHYPSPSSLSPERFAYRQIVNLGHHFRRNMPQGLFNRLAFGWYLLMMLFTDIARLPLMPRHLAGNWGRLRGHLLGLRAHLSSPALPE